MCDYVQYVVMQIQSHNCHPICRCTHIFQIPFYKILLSTETDEWAGQVTAFYVHHGDTALDS